MRLIVGVVRAGPTPREERERDGSVGVAGSRDQQVVVRGPRPSVTFRCWPHDQTRSPGRMPPLSGPCRTTRLTWGCCRQ